MQYVISDNYVTRFLILLLFVSHLSVAKTINTLIGLNGPEILLLGLIVQLIILLDNTLIGLNWPEILLLGLVVQLKIRIVIGPSESDRSG